ncbi:MAG: DUF123 domain-containing protein [Candidatus Kariarchaeaceae archaeon]|jgi:Uri superfamily endonuclease
MEREIISSKDGSIHCIGSDYPNGTYLLNIDLKKKVNIKFGRFRRGKPVQLISGNYVYIGSALAKRGATTLGNRLRRHTLRSDNLNPHKIQYSLSDFFDNIGISYTKNPSPKNLFWNIDHLLNLPTAEITNIIFIRDPKSLENTWSKFLEDLPETNIFEKGLGANDSLGHTHVQYSLISEDHWNLLPHKLPICKKVLTI